MSGRRVVVDAHDGKADGGDGAGGDYLLLRFAYRRRLAGASAGFAKKKGCG